MNATIWMCRIAVVLLPFAVGYDVFAHHEPQHREVYIGEYTENEGLLHSCLSKENMETIYETGKHSQEAFLTTYQMFAMMGQCGDVQGYVKVVEVIDVHMIGSMPLSFVKMHVSSDRVDESPELYSVLVNISVAPVRNAEQKTKQEADQKVRCVECRPA